uniref:Golgi-associated plant pathogenesis-related protein 1 n=2 Tax=Passeriformes TaxID=9126 RepID=A0A803V4A5_FICAL
NCERFIPALSGKTQSREEEAGEIKNKTKTNKQKRNPLGHGEIRYAEELATTRVLKHSSESANGNCGENLAWASYDQSGKDVADRWYSEIKNYSFQNPGFSSRTGHFTAMVWKNTKKMGVGKASASDGSTFVVARYDPAGNVVNPGYYEENVLPPRK